MRDYAELVKALRMCKLSIPCTECPFYSNGDEPSKECATMNVAAADAIEELLAEKSKLENSGKLLVAAFDRLKEKVPHWISVEERLPDPGQKVLTLGPRGALDCGKFIGLSGTERTNWQDWHWQRFGTRKVRFWMPVGALPEPPKEDAK